MALLERGNAMGRFTERSDGALQVAAWRVTSSARPLEGQQLVADKERSLYGLPMEPASTKAA